MAREQLGSARHLETAGRPSVSARIAGPGSGRYRVYNLSRDRFLFVEVAVVDTTAIPLKVLIDGLGRDLDSWLWLKPYRGIPFSPGPLPFDLVYVDQDHRVIQEVKSWPDPNALLLRAEPKSALVLPFHTVFASQIRPGDQLAFREIAPVKRHSQTSAADDNSGRQGNTLYWTDPEPKGTLLTLTSKQADISPGTEPSAPDDVNSSGPKKESLGIRLLRWILGSHLDRRAGSRQALPGLMVYYFTGGAPKGYLLGDISRKGFYLLTDERPMLGTTILMNLQQTDSAGNPTDHSIPVFAKAVRWGPDGIGFEFVAPDSGQPGSARLLANRGADRKTLDEFLRLNKPTK